MGGSGVTAVTALQEAVQCQCVCRGQTLLSGSLRIVEATLPVGHMLPWSVHPSL